ncbi:MAG: hypothetical protein AB1505_10380 [Candidatus Latescibacterota bacterium]
MAAEPLSYWDYVKAAFTRRWPFPLLGRMPANQMAVAAFVVAGIANPGFWLLGAALELGYLGWLSSSGSFQKLVQGERLLARQGDFEQRVQRTASSLSPDLAARYRRLLEECALILGLDPSSAGESAGSLRDVRSGSLNQLLWLFLRLLGSRDVLRSALASSDRTALDADIARLEERLAQATPDSPLARSLQATMDIQAKRQQNLRRARESLEVVDAELERIERQVRLIREETAVSGGPAALSARLDAVSATLSETSHWMDQHADLMGSLAGEEAEGAVLPRLPEAPAAPPPPPPRAGQKG